MSAVKEKNGDAHLCLFLSFRLKFWIAVCMIQESDKQWCQLERVKWLSINSTALAGMAMDLKAFEKNEINERDLMILLKTRYIIELTT